LPPKEGEALTKVREIAVAIMTYYQEYRSAQIFESKLQGVVYTKDILGPLASFEDQENRLNLINPRKIQFLDWSPKNMKDPWGNDYHLIWSFLDTQARELNVMIWSDGPNNINEFGQGDDIYSLNGKMMEWPK